MIQIPVWSMSTRRVAISIITDRYLYIYFLNAFTSKELQRGLDSMPKRNLEVSNVKLPGSTNCMNASVSPTHNHDSAAKSQPLL